MYVLDGSVMKPYDVCLRDASLSLGISQRRLARLCNAGTIPAVKRGGRWEVPASTVQALHQQAQRGYKIADAISVDLAAIHNVARYAVHQRGPIEVIDLSDGPAAETLSENSSDDLAALKGILLSCSVAVLLALSVAVYFCF
jgi:hypothetical protein